MALRVAKSHTDIPRDEDSGVGRTSLVVMGHIDGHILEGWPHVTIAKTYQDGRTKVTNHDSRMIICEKRGH